jgi:hypothetical protein
MTDLTIIYYTSNWLDSRNPHFLANTRKVLLEAAGGLPIISVSQKPIDFGQNICIGEIGRSNINIYRQILTGAKAAKTPYVAMAEDDVLYTHAHFHKYRPQKTDFAYDLSKWSIFTWTKPPMFSYRVNRKVINTLIAKRDALITALEERFNKFKGVPDEKIPTQWWAEPGRYEKELGVTVHPTEAFKTCNPNIVFSHPEALGYLIHGEKKPLGSLRAMELPDWGRAEDILKLYFK